MRIISVVIYFLCFTLSLQAQVPGYMGKKFSAGYDFHFYLGGVLPDTRTYDEAFTPSQHEVFLNYIHEFHADYVLAKNYSIGLSYQSFKTGQYFEENEPYYPQNYTYSSSNYINMKCYSIVLNNKFFFYKNGTGLAPIGNYGELGIGIVNAQSIVKMVGIYNDYYTLKYSNKKFLLQDVRTPIISGGLGNQSIVFDRIIIDAGINVAFLPGTIKGLVSNNNNVNYNSLYLDTTLAENKILTRMQTFYLTSVKIGIGVLLF